MIKRLTTILLATLIAMQLTAIPATYAKHTSERSEEIKHTTMIANAETTKNKLIILKPSTLPGPGGSQQADLGGVRKWFTDIILPGWAKGLVGFVGMLSFLMLVISGIKYMTAYGNDEAASSAKKMIIYSILALLLSIFSYSIVYIIITLRFN